MIEHEGRTFDDDKLKPYAFSRRICRNFYYGECEIFIVYGMPEGIGKSAYVHHVGADVRGFMKCKNETLTQLMWRKPTEETAVMPKWESDWDGIKPLVLYLPEDVVDTCLDMLDHERREPFFHWDDAGTWLYLMKYYDPFVVAFMEYLSLARSNWGTVVLSTPVIEWVLKKLHSAEGIMKIKISKTTQTERRYIFKPRLATCRTKRTFPPNPRPYYPRIFEDTFCAIMPDDFYAWYYPIRRSYAKIAVVKMRRAIMLRKAKGWNTEKAEEVLAQMEAEMHRANEKARELREAVIQHSA